MEEAGRCGIDLLWIPLGEGGWFVRFNGRVWEAAQARRHHRAPLELYHTALEVSLPDGRYVVENAWPIPDLDGSSRGVVCEGPVFSRRLRRLRALRYEVRCWPEGTIADASWAIGGPRRVSDDAETAQQVLAVLSSMPPRVWGRRVPEADDMWNSNSTISWALTRCGVEAAALCPPPRGRAPGWDAGVCVALAEMGNGAAVGEAARRR
jgi:hypothetical protein